jgi:hypothetical protein
VRGGEQASWRQAMRSCACEKGGPLTLSSHVPQARGGDARPLPARAPLVPSRWRRGRTASQHPAGPPLGDAALPAFDRPRRAVRLTATKRVVLHLGLACRAAAADGVVRVCVLVGRAVFVCTALAYDIELARAGGTGRRVRVAQWRVGCGGLLAGGDSGGEQPRRARRPTPLATPSPPPTPAPLTAVAQSGMPVVPRRAACSVSGGGKHESAESWDVGRALRCAAGCGAWRHAALGLGLF